MADFGSVEACQDSSHDAQKSELKHSVNIDERNVMSNVTTWDSLRANSYIDCDVDSLACALHLTSWHFSQTVHTIAEQ
jgi:hypothetical protein